MELLTPFTFEMTVYDFMQKALYFDPSEFILECKSLELPKAFNHWQCPENFDSITYGQRIDLSGINSTNFITLPLFIIAGLDESNIAQLNASKVLRFSFMAIDEMTKMNERDEKYLTYEPEEAELKAGVKKMNHGIFGVIDTIAKRCPQYTHEEVLKLGQQQVYMMLKIDIDNANYAKRLRKVLSEKK